MRQYLQFYIDGAWIDPVSEQKLAVINPANEEIAGYISLGSTKDVDKAVHAAKSAFNGWGESTRETRLGLLRAIEDEYKRRYIDMADAITEEMGAPTWFARTAQAFMGIEHVRVAIEALEHYRFEERRGSTTLIKEPIGVCAFITPWNWPVNQISSKVAPAIATGCTMILKPSEIAPFSAQIWTEIIHAAGVPPGVFNLVNGDGPNVGKALAVHPDVDMVSFTGSTRAGVDVAKNAAATVKRVHQELGGKSPNIILDDAGFSVAVAAGIAAVMRNSGQSCNAPTRMLVPKSRMKEATEVAAAVTGEQSVGPPETDPKLGPVVSDVHWAKIQRLIQAGIDEGAELVIGGVGRPAGLDKGYYVKPTVFANVRNDMTVAREEIFGPVATIIGYDDVDDAISIANDTEYGLAGFVSGTDEKLVSRIASKLRVGQVIVNGAPPDLTAPFGGYKRSGNGREWGEHAFGEFLELKAIVRQPAAS